MYFANPIALWFLLFLAVPIVIHLFNFRRFKRVYFSNVAMLREIKIDTQSTNRLKHLLVLITRMLAMACIAFAFAQPFIKSKNSNKKGQTSISVFVDNSFSMNAENKNGNLLESAKKAAKEIALAYAPSDRFQLLTNDFEGRHQRFYTREEFLNLLDNVQSSPECKTIQQILKRQEDALHEESSLAKKVYLISDFQKAVYQATKLDLDSSIQSVLVPVFANETTNIYIDSIWFDNPNHQLNSEEKLNVHIKSSGSDNQTFENLPLKLYINNEQKALASFNIENNSTAQVQLSYTNRQTGMQKCRIELQDFPINFDNNFYFNYAVSEHIQVLCINDGASNTYLHSLFATDTYCQYQEQSISSLNINDFKNYQFVILSGPKNISTGLAQELEKFMKDGGAVCLIPSSSIDLASYNQFLNSCQAGEITALDTNRFRVERINLQHPLYRDVFEAEKLKKNNLDLPVVFKHFGHKRKTKSRSDWMLQLQNGDDLMFTVPVFSGNLYVITSPLDPLFSNFVKHALFVPSIYKAAVTSFHQNNLYFTIGNSHTVDAGKSIITGDAVYHLKNESLKFDVIPATQNIDGKLSLSLHNQVKESGNYELVNQNKVLQALSFNYNKQESSFQFYSISELTEALSDAGLRDFTVFANKGKSLTQTVKEENSGISLWRTFIWLSLIFLLIEAILLSNFKWISLLSFRKTKTV